MFYSRVLGLNFNAFFFFVCSNAFFFWIIFLFFLEHGIIELQTTWIKLNLPLKGFISKFNFCTNPGLTQLWTTWPSAARCNVTICFVRVHVCNCYTFIFGVTNHAGMWCHVKIVNDIEIYPLVCSREYMWLWFKCQVCLYLFEFKNEWVFK